MTEGLERHYRTLIALYPRAHRTRYQQEMLTTLMDGASDGQRLPRWREFLDLVWNAARLRLVRESTPRGLDARWVRAGRIFAPLAALVFGALHVFLALGVLAWKRRLGDNHPFVSDEFAWQAAAFACAWLAVALLALTPLRVLAAAGAWIATLGHVAWKVSVLPEAAAFVSAWPSVVAGVTIAVCLSLHSDGRAARRAVGLPLLAVFTLLATTFGASLWIDVMLADLRIDPRDELGRPSGYSVDMWGANFPVSMWTDDPIWLRNTDTFGAFPFLVLLGLFAVTVAVLVKIGPEVRGRVLTLAAVPIAALLGSVELWTWFAALPLAVLGIGVLLVRRKDNQRRLIELGRAHDRAAG